MKYFEPRSDIVNNTNQKWENMNQLDFTTTFKNSAAKRTKLNGLKRNISNVKEADK